LPCGQTQSKEKRLLRKKKIVKTQGSSAAVRQATTHGKAQKDYRKGKKVDVEEWNSSREKKAWGATSYFIHCELSAGSVGGEKKKASSRETLERKKT